LVSNREQFAADGVRLRERQRQGDEGQEEGRGKPTMTWATYMPPDTDAATIHANTIASTSMLISEKQLMTSA
jgi:hypothetical protein